MRFTAIPIKIKSDDNMWILSCLRPTQQNRKNVFKGIKSYRRVGIIQIDITFAGQKRKNAYNMSKHLNKVSYEYILPNKPYNEISYLGCSFDVK